MARQATQRSLLCRFLQGCNSVKAQNGLMYSSSISFMLLRLPRCYATALGWCVKAMAPSEELKKYNVISMGMLFLEHCCCAVSYLRAFLEKFIPLRSNWSIIVSTGHAEHDSFIKISNSKYSTECKKSLVCLGQACITVTQTEESVFKLCVCIGWLFCITLSKSSTFCFKDRPFVHNVNNNHVTDEGWVYEWPAKPRLSPICSILYFFFLTRPRKQLHPRLINKWTIHHCL